MFMLQLPGMRADGACQLPLEKYGINALTALEEVKNEIGMGGCDQLHQCGIGYRFYYAREDVRPVLPPFHFS